MPNFITPKAEQIENDREKAREIVLGRMLEWYLQESPPGVVPVMCEDRKAYKGKVLRWFEPLIPGVTNPRLVEEFLGDSFSLKLEPIETEIKVYLP